MNDSALPPGQRMILCDQCGRATLAPAVSIKRFCCTKCKNDWHTAQKRRGLELLRAAQEQEREP